MVDLKIGDYVVAVDNFPYAFANNIFFAIKGKKYPVVNIITEELNQRNVLIPVNKFIIIDECKHRHTFDFDCVNSSGFEYFFDTITNQRIKKIKSLYL